MANDSRGVAYTMRLDGFAIATPFISSIPGIPFATLSKQANSLLQTHQKEIMSFGKQLEGGLALRSVAMSGGYFPVNFLVYSCYESP